MGEQKPSDIEVMLEKLEKRWEELQQKRQLPTVRDLVIKAAWAGTGKDTAINSAMIRSINVDDELRYAIRWWVRDTLEASLKGEINLPGENLSGLFKTIRHRFEDETAEWILDKKKTDGVTAKFLAKKLGATEPQLSMLKKDYLKRKEVSDELKRD